jgi:hypothetical protein
MNAEELDALKAELREKYPKSKLKGMQTKDGDVLIFRSPSMSERTLLIPKIKRNEDAAAHKQLTLQVTVYPPKEQLELLLAKYPFLCERITDAAVELGGGETEDLGEF